MLTAEDKFFQFDSFNGRYISKHQNLKLDWEDNSQICFS